MTDSNTRKWWRTRIKGIMGQSLATDHDEWDDVAEGWLDDFMQTPELSLAELAESNPHYRLAVVDLSRSHFVNLTTPGAAFYVVKMEEK